jgi:hypothetical protein
MEFVGGGTLDDAGDIAVVEEYPMALSCGSEGGRERAPDPGTSGLPVAPRHGRMKITGQHEGVPDTQ